MVEEKIIRRRGRITIRASLSRAASLNPSLRVAGVDVIGGIGLTPIRRSGRYDSRDEAGQDERSSLPREVAASRLRDARGTCARTYRHTCTDLPSSASYRCSHRTDEADAPPGEVGAQLNRPMLSRTRSAGTLLT